MTRQNMLYKITGALGLIMTSPNMHIEDGAELIMSIVEELGMHPPRYEACAATGKKYNPETDQGRDTFYINGWEKETITSIKENYINDKAIVIPEDHDPQF